MNAPIQNSTTQTIPPPLPQSEAQATSPKKKNRWKHFPQVLRWIGGISLLVSTASFLLSSWVDAGSLQRYYSFLGLTGVLTACGIFCIHRWKDDKGARTFLALATAVIPAHFAMLGALVYAEANGAAASFSGKLNTFAFAPLEQGLLIITLAIAGAALLPISFTGFSALARNQAKKLTAIYFLANATLLLPIREGNWIAGICFVLMSVLIFVDRRFFASAGNMQTRDGIATRAMLFVPLALVTGRNLLLHGATPLLISLISAAIACLFFLGLPRCTSNKKLQQATQFLSLAPAFISWAIIADVAFISGHDIHALFFPLILLPFSLLLGLQSFFVVGTGLHYRRFAACIALFATVAQMLVFGGAISAILCILVAIAVIIAAFAMEEKGLFYAGSIGLSIGSLYHLRFATDIYQENLWLALAITGTAVILLSSYIERHGRQLVQRTHLFRHKLKSWK